MSHTFNKELLKAKVVKGRHDEVFEELRIDALHESLQNQVRLLETRHHTLERTNDQGIMSRDDYKVERAEIDRSLLRLIDDIEEELAENVDTTPIPTHAPTQPQPSGETTAPSPKYSSPPPRLYESPRRSANPLYMAIAVFGALIFGALFVLMGLYLLTNNSQPNGIESGPDGAPAIYVEKKDDIDSESAEKIIRSVVVEGTKPEPPSPSKDSPPPKLPSVADEVALILPSPMPVPQSTRYECKINCKSIKFVYAGLEDTATYDISILEQDTEYKQEIGKIHNSKPVKISTGYHTIFFKDEYRELSFTIFIEEGSECVTLLNSTEPMCKVKCLPQNGF